MTYEISDADLKKWVTRTKNQVTYPWNGGDPSKSVKEKVMKLVPIILKNAVLEFNYGHKPVRDGNTPEGVSESLFEYTIEEAIQMRYIDQVRSKKPNEYFIFCVNKSFLSDVVQHTVEAVGFTGRRTVGYINNSILNSFCVFRDEDQQDFPWTPSRYEYDFYTYLTTVQILVWQNVSEPAGRLYSQAAKLSQLIEDRKSNGKTTIYTSSYDPNLVKGSSVSDYLDVVMTSLHKLITDALGPSAAQYILTECKPLHLESDRKTEAVVSL